jgi:membrane fusion protein (multidrug efflux system)
MAYKNKYALVAIAGIGMASALAWWLQRPEQGASGAASATAAAAPASAPASGAARVPAVEVAKVQAVTLVDEAQSVGSLRSRQGVVIRPEVAGRVKTILFAEGERVQKGQLLVQLDDQLQAALLAQAKAEMSIAEANHKRNQELLAQNFISKRSVDESAAALEVARAKHELAWVSQQRLRLVAPFDGVMGLKQVNVGDYLKDGADMVNIEDIDAVLVDFRLPERFQSKIRPGQTAQLTADALPGKTFTALVQAVDPLIDANGRSVGIRGCIDNRQRQLRPGMFARVNTVFGVRERALTVPEEAIVPQAGRTFVIKLVPGEKPDTLVSQRTAVKTGLRQPGRVEILEGLEEGETVVTAGQQRLQKDGVVVRVVDMAAAAKAAASAASAPAQAASLPGSAAPAQKAASAAPAAAQRGPSPCQRG